MYRTVKPVQENAGGGRAQIMITLDDYRAVAGEDTIEDIYQKASALQGRRVTHINSTSQGGGVAEILNSLVPLMNDVGIGAVWKVIPGNPDFFTLTKGFHNALQGASIELNEEREQLYVTTSEAFSTLCEIDADLVIVHDPQPLPLIQFYDKSKPWVWRCHIDLTHPNAQLWDFLKPFVQRYDLCVVSSEAYKKDDVPVEQRIIFPAIDPLSPKNMELPWETVCELVRKAGIPMDKPVITQVSRMDKWKDPEGLLEVFELVRKRVDCRLVYCYSSSVDDPEGTGVLSRIRSKAKGLAETGDVVFVEGTDPILVNAIQRFSNVMVQKSIREGFCLCVTEALWKGKPAVGTNVGGIPIQIREAENGFLVDPGDNERFADRIVQLLEDPDLAEKMGQKGKEVVRQNFLITRLLSDYLYLLSDLLWRQEGEHDEPLTYSEESQQLCICNP
jgi:trehalose synthase